MSGLNFYQRRLRTVSDGNMDDTAIEMDACERARLALAVTRLALDDGAVDLSEARSILAAQLAVIEGCDLSLAQNLAIQRELDDCVRLLRELPGQAPAATPPRRRRATPSPSVTDVFFDADLRRRYPELGAVTVEQVAAVQERVE